MEELGRVDYFQYKEFFGALKDMEIIDMEDVYDRTYLPSIIKMFHLLYWGKRGSL